MDWSGTMHLVFEKEKEVKPGGLVHYSEHTARGTSRKVGHARATGSSSMGGQDRAFV